MRTHHTLQPRTPEQTSYSIRRRDGKQFLQLYRSYLHGTLAEVRRLPARRSLRAPERHKEKRKKEYTCKNGSRGGTRRQNRLTPVHPPVFGTFAGAKTRR